MSATSISESMSFSRLGEPPVLRSRSSASGLAYVSIPEHRFLLLVEPLQEAALVLNRGGCVHACNERFAGLIGSPRSIVLGQIFASYLVNEEAAAFRRLMASAVSGIACAGFGLLHMDNSVIQVRIALRALPAEAGTAPLTCATVHPLPQDVGRPQPRAGSAPRPSPTLDPHRSA